MDCEKFESALMDELYGELDELTSAAVKRHVAGCARCAALLGGLRATRRVAALPMIDAPDGLTERILAATARVQPVMPLGLRVARAVSLAGSWAMRPQTAMAAVFLVMIGTSVLLLRGKSSRAPASAEMTVTEDGTPAPASPTAVEAKPEPTSGAMDPPLASAAPAGKSGERMAAGDPGGPPAAPAYAPLDDARRAKSAMPARGEETVAQLNGASGGAGATGAMRGPGFASPPAPASPSPVAAAPMIAAAAPAAQAYAVPPPAAMAPPPEAESTAAAPIEPSAELLAARTARDAAARQGRPCPSGPRFDNVASRASGTPTGWDALLEGALCYETIGDWSSARSRLGALLGVDTHRYRARAELDRLNKIQYARGSSNTAASAGRAAPKAAAAPVDAPATDKP